jgi:1-acyl-sn-glycerol-3-phosphate acyltransferase
MNDKNALLNWFLETYGKYRLKKDFHAIHIKGLENLKNLPRDQAVLGLCNHLSWWDGPMMYLLTRYLASKEYYCMIDENQLNPYPYLKKIGLFSVDMKNPQKAAFGLRSALKLISNPKSLLWIFPQGGYRDASLPIKFEQGISWLLEKKPHLTILPVSIMYGFFRTPKPEVMIVYGGPLKGLSGAEIEAHLNAQFDALKKQKEAWDFTGFEKLFK